MWKQPWQADTLADLSCPLSTLQEGSAFIKGKLGTPQEVL
jgi:hypothetical protein